MAFILWDILHLQEIKLTDKLVGITTASASNNDTMMNNLVKLLNKPMEYTKENFLHIRCLCHVINLAAKKFIETFDKENDSVISVLGNLILHVRASPYLRIRFKIVVP